MSEKENKILVQGAGQPLLSGGRKPCTRPHLFSSLNAAQLAVITPWTVGSTTFSAVWWRMSASLLSQAQIHQSLSFNLDPFVFVIIICLSNVLWRTRDLFWNGEPWNSISPTILGLDQAAFHEIQYAYFIAIYLLNGNSCRRQGQKHKRWHHCQCCCPCQRGGGGVRRGNVTTSRMRGSRGAGQEVTAR